MSNPDRPKLAAHQNFQETMEHLPQPTASVTFSTDALNGAHSQPQWSNRQRNRAAYKLWHFPRKRYNLLDVLLSKAVRQLMIMDEFRLLLQSSGHVKLWLLPASLHAI